MKLSYIVRQLLKAGISRLKTLLDGIEHEDSALLAIIMLSIAMALFISVVLKVKWVLTVLVTTNIASVFAI